MHRRIGRWYVRKLLEGMSTSEALLVRKAYRLAYGKEYKSYSNKKAHLIMSACAHGHEWRKRSPCHVSNQEKKEQEFSTSEQQ